jgi:hypothetical protein
MEPVGIAILVQDENEKNKHTSEHGIIYICLKAKLMNVSMSLLSAYSEESTTSLYRITYSSLTKIYPVILYQALEVDFTYLLIKYKKEMMKFILVADNRSLGTSEKISIL